MGNRYPSGLVVTNHPEEFTLDVPDRWALCFALNAYIWQKVTEWIEELQMIGTDYEHFDLMAAGRRKNVEDLVKLYHHISAWYEDEGKDIWLVGFDRDLEELRKYGSGD